jgi:DNA-3-methyladenine glycosylase II
LETPRERALIIVARRTEGRLHSVAGELEDAIVEPFDFRQSLNFLQGFGPMSGEQDFERGAVTKAIMVEGQTVVFRVSEASRENAARGKSKLHYEMFSQEPVTSSVEDSVARRIAFFLSLEDDVKPFYAIAKRDDAKFYPLVERSWGLHQVKFLTLLEICCWAILSQRVQRPIAIRMKRAITEKFGGSLDIDGKAYWAFPDYTKLKDAKPKELLEVTRNQTAMQRLTSLLSTFDELDEDFLKTAPYDKAAARLEKVKGIGDWSSLFILFRGLGRVERLSPINLRPLTKAIESVYAPSGKTLEEINSTYGSWSGYWSVYLWASTMKH